MPKLVPKFQADDRDCCLIDSYTLMSDRGSRTCCCDHYATGAAFKALAMTIMLVIPDPREFG